MEGFGGIWRRFGGDLEERLSREPGGAFKEIRRREFGRICRSFGMESWRNMVGALRELGWDLEKGGVWGRRLWSRCYLSTMPTS